MTTATREFLESFDALSDREKHEVVVELLRRSTADGGLSDEALNLAVEEAFVNPDAKVEAKNAQAKRTAG
jgi:hypothetical protein